MGRIASKCCRAFDENGEVKFEENKTIKADYLKLKFSNTKLNNEIVEEIETSKIKNFKKIEDNEESVELKNSFIEKYDCNLFYLIGIQNF